MKLKNRSITIFAVLISVLLAGIGVDIFVECGMGADTLTVLIQGVGKSFNISLGTANYICDFALLLLALILSRKDIGFATILFTVSIGFMIDLLHPYIKLLGIADYSFIMKIVMILIAQLCFAFCYAILIKYREGMGCVDAIIYFFVNNFRIPYIVGRTFMDVVFTLSGWLLGGVVGVGTIIACVTTGFMVDGCLKILNKS